MGSWDLGILGFWNFSCYPDCPILASFVFCLLITSGDYITPYLIGGKITFIGNMIAPKFGQFYDWPGGSAMSFTMLTISILIIILTSYLFKLTDPK